MAEILKVLGQSNPTLLVLTDMYTVPTSTNATVSSIVVANRTAVADKFRISIAPGGAADTNEQYIYYDIIIPGNDTFVATIGITLQATDVVRVYSRDGSLSFNLFGLEVT